MKYIFTRRDILKAGAAYLGGTAVCGTVFSYGAEAAGESGYMKHMKTESTIGDMLIHPAFKDFAEHMLSREGDAHFPETSFGNIGSLMPYHSHVNGGDVVAALNRMIDEAANGKTIFYDIYSAGEKKADPGKRAAGLFLLRGRPQAPFAVICPGGGFSYVASFHEGFPYAMELNKRGYNAFVLKYRTGRGGGPAIEDLYAALHFIFGNAEALDVSTKDYSLWGSSAGARMAAHAGANALRASGGKIPPPAAVITAYTGYSDYSADDPPTFAVVGSDDSIASPSVMRRRINAIRNAGTDAALDIYPNVGHGFGTGTGTAAEGWILRAVNFWEKHIKPG